MKPTLEELVHELEQALRDAVEAALWFYNHRTGCRMPKCTICATHARHKAKLDSIKANWLR